MKPREVEGSEWKIRTSTRVSEAILPNDPHNVEIREVRVQVLLPYASSKVVPKVVWPNNQQVQQINDPTTHNNVEVNEPTKDEPQEVELRRSERQKRSAIFDDYLIYLHELEIN